MHPYSMSGSSVKHLHQRIQGSLLETAVHVNYVNTALCYSANDDEAKWHGGVSLVCKLRKERTEKSQEQIKFSKQQSSSS